MEWRLLLGPWDMGSRPDSRPSLDTRLLGLEQWRLCLECWILGPSCRLLWRSELRFWLWRRWICWQFLGRGLVQLQ
jgi:hypothetical protein